MALTPNQRKGRLVAVGSGVRQVARDLGYQTHSVVSLVVRGEMRSARVEQYIAELLGEPAEAIFGPMPVSPAATATADT